jgi:hypothetical protein
MSLFHVSDLARALSELHQDPDVGLLLVAIRSGGGVGRREAFLACARVEERTHALAPAADAGDDVALRTVQLLGCAQRAIMIGAGLFTTVAEVAAQLDDAKTFLDAAAALVESAAKKATARR